MITKLQQSLKEFDECFIASCKNKGLSPMETQRTLMESPQRKAIADSIVLITETSTSIPPLLIPKDK